MPIINYTGDYYEQVRNTMVLTFRTRQLQNGGDSLGTVN